MTSINYRPEDGPPVDLGVAPVEPPPQSLEGPREQRSYNPIDKFWGIIIPPVCVAVSAILTLAIIAFFDIPLWVYLPLNTGLFFGFMALFGSLGSKSEHHYYLAA